MAMLHSIDFAAHGFDVAVSETARKIEHLKRFSLVITDINMHSGLEVGIYVSREKTRESLS